jgi:hypothetical protein
VCFTGFGTEFCGYKCVENTQTDGRLKLATFGSVLLLALALVLVAPLRAAAQGGPPLLTDDPGTPGPGNWEINTAFTAERDKSSWLSESPLIDVNYGMGEHVQLKFQLAWMIQGDDRLGKQTGLGNSLIGVKWRFIGGENSPFAVSVYPQLELNNSASAARRGLVESGTQFLLPVQFARKVGPIQINGEFGFNFRSQGNNQWLYGVALGHEFSPKLELIGEVHDLSSTSFRENELVFDIGGRLHLNETYGLLFSFGRSLPGATDGVPHFLAYMGIQFTF